MSLCCKCHREAPDGALFCSFCGDSIKPVTQPGQAIDPLIGQTVAGKYFIHQLLGRGGMGDVYKATHLTLDRPVVLKLLKKLFHSDPSLVQRFHREARAASRLNHPNSITIIDFGQTDDGTLFMAMEYLSGRSLERVIIDEQPIPESRVTHVGAQILAALAEAHALGIIHRDLKPANVMIEPRRDEPYFVKVLDFGIAKLNEPGDGGAGLTQAGIVCGTPGYMSTEQVRGEELDARSDLYAVGVILYEMLTGVLPFESDTPMGLVTKHLSNDPPPITVRRPGVVVSPLLEGIIMRSLARDRRDRFASADDMRAALLACASGVSAQSSQSTPAPTSSSTIIFDPAALPGTPARPATGSTGKAGAPSAVKAYTAEAVQARMTAAFEEPATPPPPPPQKTPAPAQKTPPPAQEPPRPSAAKAPAPAKKTPAPAKKTPAPAKPSPAVPRASGKAEAPGRKSKTPVVIGAAAAAVVVLGAVGFFAMRGPSKSAEPADTVVAAQPPVIAQPKPAPPPVQPEPVPPPPVQPSPPVVEATAPNTETAPAVERKPERKPERKLEVKTVAAAPRSAKGIRAVGQDLNSIPTPSESSGDGVLTVVATPWAEVVIDGRDVGETPREMRLGAGSYRVRASHPALGTRELTIVIKSGKRQTWNPTFAN